MRSITRREALRLAAIAPLAAGFTWSAGDAQKARDMVAQSSAFQPHFFTDHEYETVKVLVDIILPADERSGSATEAGVPEFMDFMMMDRPDMQGPMRGGLGWLDYETYERHGTSFLDGTDEQRRGLLDLIAWPEKAPAELSHGVAFFNSFRDLTASGFWSSRMGVDDLQYIGNVFVPEWTGCPPEALEKLGVSYDD
jgi:hypothetical protein